jgi:hypothetical protein
MVPGRKSAFRAIFCPDCSQECPGIGPSADLRPAGEDISVFSWYQSGQHLAKEADLLSGTIGTIIA